MSFENADDRSGMRPMVRPVLSVENVSYSFSFQSAASEAILDRISFVAHSGELVVVAGPSGCGKTTLLTLISGTRQMQQGSITVDGLQLREATPRLLRQARSKIGIVFQSHRLIQFLSVRQNVLAGIEAHRQLSRERKEKLVHELLRLVGLEEFLNHAPHQLSGGQRQRVGLARALANYPKLLIADEPTASLDFHTATTIVKAIRSISRELSMAVVMSTHDQRVMDQADHILHL